LGEERLESTMAAGYAIDTTFTLPLSPSLSVTALSFSLSLSLATTTKLNTLPHLSSRSERE
jgi:hypothetical protein